MTTLYVSGPMTNRPHHGWPEFIDATARLRAAGYRVISPHEFGKEGVEDGRSMLLRIDLAVMLGTYVPGGGMSGGADAVATLDGWADSEGAQLEVGVAAALDMKINPLGWWLSEAIGEGAHPGEINAAGLAAVREWRERHDIPHPTADPVDPAQPETADA